MNKRYWYQHVCVARNEDFVNLNTSAWCLTGAACQKCWTQAQSLADPVIDV